MTSKQLYSNFRRLVEPILTPLGFTSKDSNRSCFYRQQSDDVWHFILPSLGREGATFDVYIYANSPQLVQSWGAKFPDSVPMVHMDNTLDRDSVGLGVDTFYCENVERMERYMKRYILPSLTKNGLPYLEKINTTEDLIAGIKFPIDKANAYFAMGNKEKACELLVNEKARLKKFDNDPNHLPCDGLLAEIEKLLKKAKR